MPYEEVRDFFYDRHNHIAELDDAAEELFADSGLTVGGLDLQLSASDAGSNTTSPSIIRTDEPDRRRTETRLRPGCDGS